MAKQQDQSSNLHEQSNETGLALADANIDTKHQGVDKKILSETSNSTMPKDDDYKKETEIQGSAKIITTQKSSKTQRVEEETTKQSRSKLVKKGKVKDSKTSSGEIVDLDIQLDAETQAVTEQEVESQKANLPDSVIKTTRKVLQDALENQEGLALADTNIETEHQGVDKETLYETSNSTTLKDDDSKKDTDIQGSSKIMTMKKSSKTQREEEDTTTNQRRSKLVKKGKIKDSKTSSGEIEDLDIQLEAETQAVIEQEEESQKTNLKDSVMKTTRKVLQDDLENQELILSSQDKLSSSSDTVASSFGQDSDLRIDVKDLPIEKENKTGRNIDNSEVILGDNRTEDVVSKNKLAEELAVNKEEDNSLASVDGKVTLKTKRVDKAKHKSTSQETMLTSRSKEPSTNDHKSGKEDAVQNVEEEEMFQKNKEGKSIKEYSAEEEEVLTKEVAIEGEDAKINMKKSETQDTETQYYGQKDENKDSTRDKAIECSDEEPSKVVENKDSLVGDLKKKGSKVKKTVVKRKEAEVSEEKLHDHETEEKIQGAPEQQPNNAQKEIQISLQEPTMQTIAGELNTVEKGSSENQHVEGKSDAFVDTAKENANRMKLTKNTKKVRGKQEIAELPSEEIMEPVKGEIVDSKATEKESIDSPTGETIQLHKEDETLLDKSDNLAGDLKKGLKLKKRKVVMKKEQEEEDTILQDQSTDQDKQKTQKSQSIITSNKVSFFHFIFNQYD